MAASLHPPLRAPLPDVTTSRLLLRRFEREDADRLAPVFAQPAVWMFPYGRGFSRDETEAFTLAQIAEWNESGFGLWIAEERATSRVIGFVGISVPRFLPELLPAVEVGWRLEPSAWGKGLASEGATAALEQAFGTLGLDEVYSLPQSDNPASCAVCERIGMTFEREVVIPANERRGAVTAKVYKATQRTWRPRALAVATTKVR